MSASFDNIGGEGDVCGDYQIATLNLLGYFIIGDIETCWHLDGFYIERRRDSQWLICHQDQ